jgi:hypothetical protein
VKTFLASFFTSSLSSLLQFAQCNCSDAKLTVHGGPPANHKDRIGRRPDMGKMNPINRSNGGGFSPKQFINIQDAAQQ